MGVRVPRITLKADYGDEASFGELSLLAFGYGLHQAWVYATMFATSSLFNVDTYVTGMYGSHASLTFFVSIVVFGLCLLFAAVTNQRFLRFYVSKRFLTVGAIFTSLGTAALLAPIDSASIMLALEIACGISTGIGSAILILFWGVAFARCDSASIVLNAAVAIAVGFGVYALCLRHAPFPLAGLLVAAIPLIELAILRKKTPISYTERSEVPIFKPLPINHTRFVIRFGVPVFVLGVALGMLRQTSIQSVLPAATALDQIIMLLAAGCATVLILITILALGGAGRWNRFFRPLVPFIAVAVFLLPFLNADTSAFSSFILLVGYMCFEALMWIFFGELSQRFRLSPVFVFGIGRGLLALAALTGSLFPIVASEWAATLPLGENGIVIFVLLIMVIAYALLPDEHEIEAIVISQPDATASTLEPSADNTSPLDTGEPQSETISPFEERPRETSLGSNTQETRHPVAAEACNTLDEPVPTNQNNTGERPAEHPDTLNTQSSSITTTPLQSIARSAMQTSSSLSTRTNPEDTRLKGGRFRAKCETVANTYLLSSRETEVMFFLAKGHNSAYIQEKLYISEGTAKTHIRHIYRKLNVHAQHDLMRLVEGAEPCV